MTTIRGYVSLFFLCISSGAAQAEAQQVIWTNLVNVSVSGTILQKTSANDWPDAGATSQQEIPSGDGFVEFTVGEAGTLWEAGLSHGNTDENYGDIDFAVRFNGASGAEFYEFGLFADWTTYAAGDVFRVGVADGKVQYSKNGMILRESPTAPTYPLLLDVSLITPGATILNAALGVPPPPPSTGGLLEKAGSPVLRARFTPSKIQSFLPAGGATGKFKFPAPYYTTGVRLTNASDCAGGQDCLWYVGYSYWRNINNHAGSPTMYILLGTDPNRGGRGPTLLAYDKQTDEVRNLGPLFAPNTPHSSSTAEGWYFSGVKTTRLYTYMVGGATLRRFDVLTRKFDVTPAFDIAVCRRQRACRDDAAYVFQPHSSDDDRVHSVTVQNAGYARLGCGVYEELRRRYRFFATLPRHEFDECHVDKSGRWLMILETSPTGGVNNRVIDLQSGKTQTIEDAQGALGHLDMGFGYAVGADNWNPLENATIVLKFPLTSTQRPVGPVVHYNKTWQFAAANHVTHGNARRFLPVESQFACGSNASRAPEMADEIVCFSLDPNRNPDGSLDVLVLGQVMTDLDAAGGRDVDGDDYEQTPKGNLDPTGQYFIWTTNLGGDRLDAFLVKVPSEILAGAPRATSRKARAAK